MREREALREALDHWNPIHSAACFVQDDDAPCICGTSAVYEAALALVGAERRTNERAALAEAAPPSGRRIIMLAPVGGDGLCTGCGAKPTRETGRCKCVTGPLTTVHPAEAAPPSDPREGREYSAVVHGIPRLDALPEAAPASRALDVEREGSQREELARAWAIVDMHTDPKLVAWALHQTQSGHQPDESCWAIPGHKTPYEEWAQVLIDTIPASPTAEPAETT